MLLRQQAQAGGLDFQVHPIDAVVSQDYALRQGNVAPSQRLDGVGDHMIDRTAHLEHLTAQTLQFFSEQQARLYQLLPRSLSDYPTLFRWCSKRKRSKASRTFNTGR